MARPTRVRHLVALDAQNVMTRLVERGPEMVTLFSRHRDRGSLLGPLESWFDTVEFSSLEVLSPTEQRAISAFYETLSAVRWYLEFTEDMPLQVQQKLNVFVRTLHGRHRELVAAIGSSEDDGAPVITARVVRARSR